MISKLHIFSKKTDANVSLKGYYYQVLKSIETWVENFLKDIHEEIYCDFEEDIFQKNPFLKTVKFRQIKLYSSNFSFASEEIQKCIAHFFMLHVKTDYANLEKEFVFEANTSVAQKKLDNDAVLLRKWNENQGKLGEELLKQCSAKVQSIVSSYISENAKALAEKKESKEFVSEALEVFKLLQGADWNDFTQRIRWKFNGVSSDEEFTATREKIDSLILQLPFDISEENLPSTFGLLHTTAWNKATAEKSEDRKLTLIALKEILLQSADESEKWYWQVTERWKGVTDIHEFIIGEFYEVIDATRHCRQHPYLSMHNQQWLDILKIYIDKVQLTDDFKRTAIHEYLWLKFRPINIYEKPEGNLTGEKKYFEFYYKEFNAFRNATELEDAQTLMNIALAACYHGISELKIETVQNWFRQMDEILNARLEKETNPNEICHLLENLGTQYLFLNAKKRENKSVSAFIKPLEKILSLLGKATLYNVTTLSTRLSEYISLLIEVDPDANTPLIEAIETFTEKLNPLVEERNGTYERAKVERDKGIQYLHSSNPTHILRALNCFHKAKTLWYRQESIEGFVLTLISISHLYSAIGLNLASKYYALCAAWASIHNGSRHLLKRISDSFGLIFYADFKQGAWMNAIISFADYINARDEFKGTPLDPAIDKIPFKAMADLAIIFHISPKIAPQLKDLIDTHIGMLGQIGDDFIQPLFPKLESDFPTAISMKHLLEGKLTDKPLNDVGKKRIVRFSALGSSWEISFNNDYETTPIAEEVCGIMQVMVAEIALSKYDFHLVRGSVNIEIEVKADCISSERLPTYTEFKWKIFLEFSDSQIPEEIYLHTARNSTVLMYILEELSLLPHEEFKERFATLFTENNLADKLLVLGLYQRMYRYVFKKPRFDSLQRQQLEAVDAIFVNLPVTNSVMEWKSHLSPKYNPKEAIENIQHRFKNSYQCIYITIEKLKQEKDFPALINELRKKGFHDWQLILSIMNFMLNYKTQLEMDVQSFETEELHHEKYNKIFYRLQHTNEKDCYVKFPLAAFQSKEFKFQLNHTFVVILKSFGLENNARFPNFSSVKEFLDIRFNMSNDNSEDGNLLHDI